MSMKLFMIEYVDEAGQNASTPWIAEDPDYAKAQEFLANNETTDFTDKVVSVWELGQAYDNLNNAYNLSIEKVKFWELEEGDANIA